MEAFLGEILGTFILVLVGHSVNANVSLAGTAGNESGWIVITWGWGIAVFIAVFMTADVSGAHLNPAVTVALASIGQGGFTWAQVPGYILAQLVGAMLGATLVWLTYLPHWKETEDSELKLAAFSTDAAIRHTLSNLISEIVGTFVLVLGVLTILRPDNLVPDSGFDTGFGPVLVGLIVLSVGISLGGPTGYAINPARDLGPRLAHAILPIHGKGTSNWGYAWIPVVGPLIGGLLAAMVYRLLW